MLKKFTGIMTIGVLLLSTVKVSALADNGQYKAIIKSLKNKVEIKYGESLWRVASMNQLIRPGTRIRTGSLSRVELLYPDGSVTRIGSRTNLIILDKSFRAVKVESGKMWFKVTKKSYGLKIYSPTAVAAITGTEGYAEFGKTEPEKESGNQSIRLASDDKNFSYKTAETSTDNGFSFGLVEGSAEVYHVDKDNGEPLGTPVNIGAGQILDNNFNLLDVGINVIEKENKDVSQSDETAGKNENKTGEVADKPESKSAEKENNKTGKADETENKDANKADETANEKENNNVNKPDEIAKNNTTKPDEVSNNNVNKPNETINNDKESNNVSKPDEITNNNVSKPDEIPNNTDSNVNLDSSNPVNKELGTTNVAVENVPNTVNSEQDLNLSPTTGDLEIIIE